MLFTTGYSTFIETVDGEIIRPVGLQASDGQFRIIVKDVIVIHFVGGAPVTDVIPERIRGRLPFQENCPPVRRIAVGNVDCSLSGQSFFRFTENTKLKQRELARRTTQIDNPEITLPNRSGNGI